MKSRTLNSFRRAYRELPADVQRSALASFQLFKTNPQHGSLDFKRLRTRDILYSARVTDSYRAVAFRDGDTWVWFWIGTHSEYDELLKRL